MDDCITIDDVLNEYKDTPSIVLMEHISGPAANKWLEEATSVHTADDILVLQETKEFVTGIYLFTKGCHTYSAVIPTALYYAIWGKKS